MALRCLLLALALGLAACSRAVEPAPAPGTPAPPAAALAGQPASELAATPATDPPAWLFLIYAAIDNDAEEDGNFFEFLDGVRAGWADDPQVEIVLFADRSRRYSENATSLGEDFADGRLYRVRAGRSERLSGGAEFPEITAGSEHEPDSADAGTLRKVLAYARAHHPARHTALMLYGHADGRAMCPDEDSGHEMGFAQVTDVVPEELSVDLMALELCNMGGIEIGYQWRPGNGGFSTRYLVAIPNAGPPLDWSRVFARLREQPGLEPEALGQLTVSEGGLGREALAAEQPRLAGRLSYEAVACYDLAQAAAVKQAVDALAVQLAGGGAQGGAAGAASGGANGAARETFVREVRGPGPNGLVLDYAHGQLQRDPWVDLHDLAVRAAEHAALEAGVRDAAQAVASATAQLVVASWGGESLPRFLPGASGVYLTFPDGDAAAWKRCRWYSPEPVDGTYGRLAWCRDGAQSGDGQVQTWYELLDAWMDGPQPDGGGNGYSY